MPNPINWAVPLGLASCPGEENAAQQDNQISETVDEGTNAPDVTNKTGKGLGNPFKDKTAKEIDEMFTAKGFEKRGPDSANGTGGYVNPKTGRSYHIDPKEWGKYPEPNHVDVNRLKSYDGALDKKKLPYKE